jgi:transposase-like protein
LANSVTACASTAQITSWRVDETYVKVAGSWAYLYRAVDSAGETIEFMLSPKARPDRGEAVPATRLRATDRIIAGLCTLFMPPLRRRFS